MRYLVHALEASDVLFIKSLVVRPTLSKTANSALRSLRRLQRQSRAPAAAGADRTRLPAAGSAGQCGGGSAGWCGVALCLAGVNFTERCGVPSGRLLWGRGDKHSAKGCFSWNKYMGFVTMFMAQIHGPRGPRSMQQTWTGLQHVGPNHAANMDKHGVQAIAGALPTCSSQHSRACHDSSL